MTTATRFTESRNGSDPRRPIIDSLHVESEVPHVATMALPINGNLVDSWGTCHVQVALPGADPASLRIDLVARAVTVRGTYHIPAIESGSFTWQGIPTGDFSMSFNLPAEVDGDKAHALYERGILTISLPKVTHLKPSSIQVEMIR